MHYKMQVCPCQFLLNTNHQDASEQITVNPEHMPVKYGLVYIYIYVQVSKVASLSVKYEQMVNSVLAINLKKNISRKNWKLQ
jgi:hypothetical protein